MAWTGSCSATKEPSARVFFSLGSEHNGLRSAMALPGDSVNILHSWSLRKKLINVHERNGLRTRKESESGLTRVARAEYVTCKQRVESVEVNSLVGEFFSRSEDKALRYDVPVVVDA
ncbi:hypothetical protein F2Q68_00031911 [Brassica cretica]|uniref:Uncharacterized protein n=2 Tax=Brassica cretica TaxID=69181 RepID=A0ABQ7B6Z1_BRACR|nr:hypothetical protein F2Q68_00031911 [Brassica cretica]KAF3528312.1 hypothetical protein DY000_02041818 [Brassica cretica]